MRLQVLVFQAPVDRIQFFDPAVVQMKVFLLPESQPGMLGQELDHVNLGVRSDIQTQAQPLLSITVEPCPFAGLGAWLYNAVARRVGGFEYSIKEMPDTRVQA